MFAVSSKTRLFSLIHYTEIFYSSINSNKNKLVIPFSVGKFGIFQKMSCSSKNSNYLPKPPSILVYTNDDVEKFNKVNDSILKVIPSDTYTTRHIDTNTLKMSNWIESSTKCLVLSNIDKLEQESIDSINNFIKENGKIIIQDSKCQELFENNNVINDDNKKIDELLREIGLDIDLRSETKKLTTSYLISDKDERIFDIVGLKFSEKLGDKPKILIIPQRDDSNDKGEEIETTEDLLNVKLLTMKKEIPHFNINEYFTNLHTKKLGRLLLHSDVCTTTLDINNALLAAFPKNTSPIVVAANCQTSGIGRSGNQWISPKGCLMFSYNYDISSDSFLSKRITFIQHILVVAIVDAIHSLVDVEDLPLKIKWPNDIYWDRKYKMGGIIVKCSIVRDNYRCIIGAGINISNEKPTVCLNQFLRELYGIELSLELVLAEIMNKFEEHVKIFEEYDYEAFLENYYKYWLHKDEEVFVKGVSVAGNDIDNDDKLNEYCIIRGINEFGYLKVQGKESGVGFTVSDDGNTFDMMKGLIKTKSNY
uniref:Biotin--protein ligase (inferred by orthology to a human protein) n=1 Tax=Strongyloides venezuelensis TaxID=75913 RepID=A0A0K0FA22_STRVS